MSIMDNSDPTAMQPTRSAATENSNPLFVDLDGTLIEGDSLWEAAAALASRNIFSFIAACLSLFGGRASFKRAIAKRTASSLADFKLNESVHAFVKTEAEHRSVILATAADKNVAEALAGEAGFFSGVIASENGKNLKGAKKLQAIRAYLSDQDLTGAFDYIGDSKADRPIWSEAGTAYAVARDEASARRLAKTGSAKWIPGPASTLKDFVKAMRPHQWVKNVLIFLPLALSHQLLDSTKLMQAFAAFAAFSLCASATYILNDILDIRSDRRHARKRSRPFAAARISIPKGLLAAALLFVLSFSIALAFTAPIVIVLLAGYIGFTLTYSLYLKEKLLVDAMALGLLYGYRIIIGGAAAAVLVSDWLIAFSVFFFLGLALVKRYTEISQKAQNADGKISGRGYYGGDREIVSVLGVVSSYTSILILALYITSPDVAVLYGEPRILWVICLVMIYWLGRIWTLAHRGHMPDDPIVFALRDRVSLLCGLICGGTLLLAL